MTALHCSALQAALNCKPHFTLIHFKLGLLIRVELNLYESLICRIDSNSSHNIRDDGDAMGKVTM